MSIDSAFTPFPSLSTKRLELRRIRPGDAASLYAPKSHPDVTARYSQESHASPQDTLAWIERVEGYYDRREALFWGLELKGRQGLIGACPLAGNTPSINLLHKLGFTSEGTLRQRHFFRGEYHDILYFGLPSDEWREPAVVSAWPPPVSGSRRGWRNGRLSFFTGAQSF